MKLKEIKFQPGQEGVVIPSTVTVEMTVEEALWVATVSGKQRGVSPHSGIFECMSNNVFNRYWDDGTNDARKEFPIDTPPIKYDS
jgi:hypothetical protein